MKITDIRVIPISVPGRRRRSALGLFPTLDYGIVFVETDEGITGLGEISTLWDGVGDVQCEFVRKAFRPALLGQDPTSINKCLRLMDTLIEAAWPARAAVEMALFDIMGKYLDQPVYRLLGGRSRESVVLSRSIHMDTPGAMAAAALAAKEAGYTCVKAKVGMNPEADEAGVAAIRAAIGPDVRLRIDANMGWPTAKAAIQNIRRLSAYDLHSVEQPIPPGNVSELRLVRTSVDVPIMADESVWGPANAWEILSTGAADMLNVYVAESGGLTNSMLIFRMAEIVGARCVIGSMPEFGIGTAAAVHLGVAVSNLTDPADTCGSSYQDVDIVNEELVIRDGRAWPPEAAGLGVTLNEEVLSRYRTDGLGLPVTGRFRAAAGR